MQIIGVCKINVFVVIKCSSLSFIFLIDLKAMIVAGKLPRVASTDSPHKLWPTPSGSPVLFGIHVVWGLRYFVPSCFYKLCQQENQTAFFLETLIIWLSNPSSFTTALFSKSLNSNPKMTIVHFHLLYFLEFSKIQTLPQILHLLQEECFSFSNQTLLPERLQ